MSRITVDMNSAKEGDILISQHGMRLTYVQRKNPQDAIAPYFHVVLYPNGAIGSRTNEGWVFQNRPLPEDHDIVEIIPQP